MEVLLKEDVTNLGLAGEVHRVADGYGRNYLIPRGLAVKATTAALKQAQEWRERASARRAQLRAEYEALAGKIQGTRLVFRAKAGESGKLYGSVTMAEVADRLNRELGIDLDRRKLEGDSLRHLGEHNVAVRLSGDYAPEVLVVILPEGAPLENATPVAAVATNEEE
jgi:large subunit ribosomal protein L9